MASSEPSMSPGWLKAAKTADDHDSGTSSGRNKPPLLETPRVRTIMKPVDYTNFGRRGDRWRNAGDRDRSGRSDTDAPWGSRPDGPAVRRRVPIKRDFPAPVAEARKKPSSPVHIAPVSSGLNMAVEVAQMPSRARADPQLSVDTHRSGKSVPTERKQVKLLTPKTSGLNSSEKPKFKGAMAGKELLSQLVIVNNALRACTLGSDVSKTSQVGNLQVLNRERNATVSSSSVVEDVNDSDGNLKSPTNQNVKVECKGTSKISVSSLKRSSCSFGQAQDQINFFNSLSKIAPGNLSTGVVPDPGGCIFDASEKSSSLDEQNSGDYAGASVISQEVDVNGNGGIGRVIDDDSALGEEVQNEDFKSETHVDDKENCNQPSWSSDDNYEKIAEDVNDSDGNLKSLTNQNVKVECKGTSKNSVSSLKRSSCCFGQAQDQINFFNSLSKIAPGNLSTGVVPDPGGCIFHASEKSSSLDEQNSGDYAGASVISQEVDVNGNGGIGRVIDDDGALGEEVQNEDFKSETHVDDKENCNQPSWSSDNNYEKIADVDEEEASFLRSLGWEEHAQVEAIKDEEIAAFKKLYESLRYEKKLRPLSELSFLS